MRNYSKSDHSDIGSHTHAFPSLTWEMIIISLISA